MQRLKYINPYYWLSVFITWYHNREHRSNLAKAIVEANRLNKETGAKICVLNTTAGIIVEKRNRLKPKFKKKATYTTK